MREIKESGLIVHGHIADGLEHKWIKGLASTNCSYPCEYCMNPGCTVEHKKGILLPWPEKRYLPRTLASVKKNAAKAKRIKSRLIGKRPEKVIDRIHHKGVKVRTPLADLSPRFDVIKQSALDTMHLMAIGMSKKIFGLIFEPSKRKRWGEEAGRLGQAESARLSRQVQSINEFMRSAKVPTEFGRRPREIDSANYKASEWRYLGMYGFIHIASSILEGEEDRERAQILLIFAFVYRVVNLDDEDFLNVEAKVDLDSLIQWMAYLYEKKYGEENCTYNEHNLFVHLMQHRRRFGPLYNFSAWRFEDLYGKIERCYRPGTPHEAKQLFRGFFITDLFSHGCHWKKTLTIKTRPGTKSDDSLVVTRVGFYRVLEPVDNQSWLCQKIKTEVFSTEIGNSQVNWDIVGVRRLAVADEHEECVETIAGTEIIGKGLIVGDLVMDAKLPWLME